MSGDTQSTTGSDPAPDHPAAARPERVGRYELLEPVGEGGMGIVWSARDPELGRVVAVKLLRHTATGAAEERLRREAKTMARLVHPNVIRVYDVGVADGGVFVAMEYVSGGTLKDWLAKKPRSCDDILGAFVLAGRGLAAAHDIGLVHRDVKPSNVLVGDDGRVLVTDFGLARSEEGGVRDDDALGSSDPMTTITRTGGIVGTPAYMAPEQHAVSSVDARADQFSFAVALWSALYGAHPFPGSTIAELAEAMREGQLAPPPAATKVPAYVRGALERALSVDPAARFPSMHALIAALGADPRRRRRNTLLATGAVLAIGGSAAAWALMPSPPDPCAGPDRFAGAWDDGARHAVETAFANTKVPYAAVAFQTVAGLLDDRHTKWSAMRLETCRVAQRSDAMQAIMKPRADCLDQRLADLSAYVDTLRIADVSAVKTAVASVASVGDPGDCNNNQALGRIMPRPADPVKLRSIDAVEHELATVRAQLAAGHYVDADKQAPVIVEHARATGYPPVVASALYEAGRAAGSATRAAQAEKLLDEAELVAETAGDDALRFDCEVLLVKTVGQDLERVADGERHARRAEALLARIGDDPMRAGQLARYRASALWWAGSYADARAQAQRAVDLISRVDPTSPELARALHMRSIVEQEMGDNAASVATGAQARAIAEPKLGANHPTLGNMWNTSGGSLRNLKKYDEALVHLRHALAIFEANGPADGVLVGDAVQNIATTYLDENKFAEAVPLLRRALAISTARNGADHSRTADVLEILGGALSKSGHADEAVATLERAIAIHRAKLGPDAPPTASSVKHLGYHYLRAKRFADARAQFVEAIRALEASQGKTSGLLVRPLMGVGDAETGLGHKPEARAAYERARTLTTAKDVELDRELDAAIGKR